MREAGDGCGSWLTESHSRAETVRGPAAETGKKILAQLPTLFGRLVFLRCLRDPLTGHYAHPALTDNFGPDIADRVLSNRHHQVFMEWLRLNLEDQKADIDEYLRISGEKPADLPYRDLPPASAHDVERQLFLTDLEVLLQLLSFAPDAFSVPDASPRR